MKRAAYLAGLLLLTSCSQLEPNLVWLEPTPGSVVVGTVELTVAAVGESPENVVFYLGDEPIAKAYAEEEGRFNTVWDSTIVSPGDYSLRAKPYGGSAITTRVTVAPRRELE